MRRMLPSIKNGEHVLIVGQTGSGKTVLLCELIKQAALSPVIVLDSKLDNGFLTLNRGDETLEVFNKGLTAFERFIKRPAKEIPDYLIVRPPLDEIMDSLELDSYLMAVYTYFKNPCIMVVDELYMLHRAGRCGPGLTAMLTRGRSQGKSLYGATQRPAWVSGFCLSEATHYFIFRLLDIKDRKRLTHVGYGGELKERYHYYQYNAVTGESENKPPLPMDVESEYIDKKGWL